MTVLLPCQVRLLTSICMLTKKLHLYLLDGNSSHVFVFGESKFLSQEGRFSYSLNLPLISCYCPNVVTFQDYQVANGTAIRYLIDFLLQLLLTTALQRYCKNEAQDSKLNGGISSNNLMTSSKSTGEGMSKPITSVMYTWNKF